MRHEPTHGMIWGWWFQWCIVHPRLGHCAKSEPEAITGLWDTDRRYCERFFTKARKGRNIKVNFANDFGKKSWR